MEVEQSRLKNPAIPTWRRHPAGPTGGTQGDHRRTVVDRLPSLVRAPVSTRAGIGKACADLPSYLRVLQTQEAQPQKSLPALQTPLFFGRKSQRR